MAIKIKTIRLVGPFERMTNRRRGDGSIETVPAWEVVQVTDSIEFSPKQALDRNQVDELCESSRWKVTIVARN